MREDNVIPKMNRLLKELAEAQAQILEEGGQAETAAFVRDLVKDDWRAASNTAASEINNNGLDPTRIKPLVDELAAITYNPDDITVEELRDAMAKHHKDSQNAPDAA